MLKRLHLRNFTVFADAEFEFGEGLNVLVGTNGTGKTHVLKAGYTMMFVLEVEAMNTEVKFDKANGLFVLEPSVAKLRKVFQPIPFVTNELIRRNNGSHYNEESATINSIVTQPGTMLSGEFLLAPTHQRARATITPDFSVVPEGDNEGKPVFIPAKEVLTMGWLLPIYDLREIPIDETYPDLLRLLPVIPLKNVKSGIENILGKLAKLIGGKVEEESGRFYLAAPDQPRLEMNLVAEGMRKFATLYKLLASGTLTPETTLFWDEPEANLNPALLKEMAVVLTDLAQAGFQIILATHSLFLMKELYLLSRQRKQLVRYFGLYAGEKGDVQVEKQDDFMQLQHIAAIDAELAQTFDFDEVLDQDYAGDS